MRMYDNDIPRLVFRIAGVASIAAGVLMTAGFVLHPAGEDATFGTDPMWIPAHALLWMAFVVALLGWWECTSRRRRRPVFSGLPRLA